ncbi:MAG: aminotransferase class I/II-fold pyridoxal phosphate-dependent enzyme [Bullifex sp.]|nr:aminotransferase class I/II-fold pyridoxal phosphate-dependent enzyme [Bullifex sp.]
MNELAKELNDTLSSCAVSAFLSEKGRNLYFPKGIVAQSQEAGEKAKQYNATVGLAKSKGVPMHLSDIQSYFREGTLTPTEIFSYAPGGGDKELRAIWKKEMIRKNPSLEGKLFSEPLVTGGLTHTISMIATMFFDKGDELILPDLYWDNYELIFRDSTGCEIKEFRFFRDGGLNIEGLKKCMYETKGDTVRVLLNFPNNPTGYTPTSAEMDELAAAFLEVAESGKKILVLSDDAYFGLFFEKETATESLFSKLVDLHENIFAIKGDAATKEEMVWGFRIGFITYGGKGLRKEHLDALTKKTLGAIRCSVSNCDRVGQSLLLHAIKEGKNYLADKEKTFTEMEARYKVIREVLRDYEGSSLLKPYPFNSGYFMAFDTLGHSAEALRVYLLDKYQVGTINIQDRTLRVAYCSVEKEQLADLVAIIFRAAGELWS